MTICFLTSAPGERVPTKEEFPAADARKCVYCNGIVTRKSLALSEVELRNRRVKTVQEYLDEVPTWADGTPATFSQLTRIQLRIFWLACLPLRGHIRRRSKLKIPHQGASRCH